VDFPIKNDVYQRVSIKFHLYTCHGGPHFQSHAVPPWRRWLRRWLSRCFRRSASVVEVESSRALAVAMFHCKATPVILSSQGFPEEISEAGKKTWQFWDDFET